MVACLQVPGGGSANSMAGRSVHNTREVPLSKIAVEVHIGPIGGRGALGCDRTDRAVEHQRGTRPKSSAEKWPVLTTGTPIAKTTQRMPRQIPRLLVIVLDLAQLMYPSSDVLNTAEDRTDALKLDRSWRGRWWHRGSGSETCHVGTDRTRFHSQGCAL